MQQLKLKEEMRQYIANAILNTLLFKFFNYGFIHVRYAIVNI